MNILVYMILGWMIGESLHLFLWEYTKKKFNLDNKKVKTIFIFLGLAVLIALVGSGFYRVSSYENVVVTTITGNKIIKDSIGIKYNLLSARETINLQKQTMAFPESYVSAGKPMITKDDKPVLITASLEYQIVNVKKWSIENKNTKDKLSFLLSSEITKEIQKEDYSNLIEKKNIEQQIKQNLMEFENSYGIKIINFNLIIVDSLEVQASKSNVESQKIKSESLIKSYTSESEAIKIKYNSIEDKEFIKYLELMKMIKEGNIETILIPTNINPVINLQGGAK